MYDKCYFCLDQLPKLKKESTASFFVNFGGAGVQKSRPTLLQFTSTGTKIYFKREIFIVIRKVGKMLEESEQEWPEEGRRQYHGNSR